MKEKLKYAVITIIFTVIFVVLLVTSNVFAAAAGNTASPIKDSESKKLNYNSIFSLVDPSQVRGDQVYIRYEDLIKFPSLFCAAHGYSLPGYNSTLVFGHDKTDSGKVTGYLTAQDSGETVGWNEAEWTTSNTNTYYQVTSKTYGLFKVEGVYKATPAEAWVLSEMDKNDPKKNSINFEITEQEYTGEVKDGNKVETATGDELWSVEWDESSLEPTKFVTKKGDKFYYVTTDDYAPYTYVQHAWWKVKKIGKESKTGGDGIKDTDLAAEAQDFEKYMEKVAVLNTNASNERDKWQYNSDNTIVVDYTKYINDKGQRATLGYDSKNAEVRFNSETNKYIVGPFKLNYLRAVTKQGSREKMSFSGISQTTLTAADAKGNKLLDSEGNSVLKLGENYRFVYDNAEDHNNRIPKSKDGTPLDTAEDYPYPYDDEEFYIEIDYLDDMVSLISLDVDFQYRNAGAEFQYLTGKYLIITWTPMAIQGSEIDDGGTANATRTIENLNLAMATENVSARDGNASTDDAGGEGEDKYTNEVKTIDQNTREITGSGFELIETTEDGENDVIVKYTSDIEEGTVKGHAGLPGILGIDVNIITSLKHITGTITYENGAEDEEIKETNFDGNSVEFTVPRHNGHPKEKANIKLTVTYNIWNKPIEEYYQGGIYDTSENKTVEVEGTVTFYNKTVDGIFISSPKGEKDGDTHKIDCIGNLSESDLKVKLKPSLVNGELPANGSASIWIDSDDRGFMTYGEEVSDDIVQSDSYYECKMNVFGYDGTLVQRFKYNLYVPKMHLTKTVGQKGMVRNFSGSSKEFAYYTVYNHLGNGGYFKNLDILGVFVKSVYNRLGILYEAAPLVKPSEIGNGIISVQSMPENANDTHHKTFYCFSIDDDAGTSCYIFGIADLTNPDKKPKNLPKKIEEILESEDLRGEIQGNGSQDRGNQGEENQGEGNPGEENQDEGNQGEENQGEGNQGEGNPGEENQDEGNQGEENQGEGNQGEENQDEGNQGEGNQGEGNQGEGNQGEGSQGNGNPSGGSQGNGNPSGGNQGDRNQNDGNSNNGNGFAEDSSELSEEDISGLVTAHEEIIKILQEYIQELQDEINTLQRQRSELRQRAIDDLTARYNQLKGEYDDILKQIDETKNQKNDLENRFANASGKEKEDLKEQIAEIENKLTKLENRRDALVSEVNGLVAKIDALNELIRIEKRKAELDVLIANKREEANKVTGELNNIEKLKADKKKEIEAFENSRNEAQNNVINKNTELNDLEQEKDELLAREKELLNIISYDVSSELVEIEKKIQENEAIIEYVQAKVNELQGNILAANMGGFGFINKASNSSFTSNINNLVRGTTPSSSGHGGGGGSGSGPVHPTYDAGYYYKYYLKFLTSTDETAQDQVNGTDAIEVNIDAANGAGNSVPGPGIHLELIPEPINLRTALSGMVWIDHDEQKDSNSGKLGIYDEKGEDKPAAKNSVEIVVWKVKYDVSSGKEIERETATAWDNEGNVIDFIDNRIFVDDNGRYEIPKIQVPAEEGLDASKYVMSYDVEFIYDGQTYEATEYLVPSSGENKTTVSDKLAAFKKTADQTKGEAKDYTEYARSSYIVENADERKDFDSYFTEVYGGGDDTTHTKAISDDGKTDGKATGGKGGSQYNNVVLGDSTEKEATLNYDSTVVGGSGEGAGEKTKSKLITNDNDGYVLPQYRFAARTSEGGLLLPYERQYHVKEKYYDNFTFQKKQYKPVDEYFNQINLGLLERYHSDLGVKKDLYMANVVVNGHSNLTTYNSLAPLTDEALELQITPGYRTKTYNIDLYNSDFMYRSSAYSSITDEITKNIIEAVKEDTELRLFVTYKMEFINESVYTDVSVNEFKDYYDKTFTRVDEDITAVIEDQTADDGEPARKEKIVAYAPYYRKLKTVATPTAYKYNKAEDLNQSVGEDGKVKNTVVNGNGELILDTKKDQSFATGAVEFKEYDNHKGDYKTSYSTSLNAYKEDGSVDTDLTLEPGEVMEVFVTYEIDKEGFEKAKEETQAASDSRKDSLLGKKNNIVEISRYTTQYTTESLQRHNTVRYEAEQISGRIEQDSAPDNINMAQVDGTKLMEDDTEFAPCVTVQVRETDPRILNGIVWEDSRTDGTEGDGIYSPDTEKGIGDVDVTLVEKIRVTKEDLDRINANGSDGAKANISDLSIIDHEFEYIWPTNTFAEFANGIKSSAEGQYEFKNFVTGTYVVRFEYGNDADSETDMKYNGQDYKNTAYQAMADGSIRTNPDVATASEEEKTKIPTDTSDIKHLSGKATLNNEWHDLSSNTKAKDLEGARVSDARDYEPQRMRVNAYSRTITNKNAEVLAAGIAKTEDLTEDKEKAITHVTGEYQKILEDNKDEFVENTRMVANTAKLFVDVEKQDTIAYKNVKSVDGQTDEVVKTTDGNKYEGNKPKYEISNIDFGLVERPETRINIQKEISKIQLTKNDGQEVILSVECDEAGNIIKAGGSAENSIRVEKVVEIHKDTLGSGQGFKYIAMESSFLKGLQVKLTYNIKIFNNSEKDYISADLANKKNIDAAYQLANNLESADMNKLYSEEGISNTVPYNCGKGIIYGKYLGLHYYTNKHYESRDDKKKYESDGFERYGQEVEVTTTVDQLVDYVDNDLSISIDDTSNYENQVWVNSSDTDRKEKLSAVAYEKGQDGKYVKDDKMLQDDKERAYVSNTNNNISVSVNSTMTEKPVEVTYTKTKVNDNKQPVMKKNDQGVIVPEVEDKDLEVYTTLESGNANEIDTYNPKLTTELKPGENASIKIVTTAQASEEAINNMNYDNLVEIVMYSNTAGRRDMQTIPGNANMIAKDKKAYEAGYNRVVKVENGNVVKGADGNTVYEWRYKEATIADEEADGKVKTVHTERDAYAARDTVTFSEPTGLSLERQKINTIIRIILAGLIIAAIATIAITVMIVIKKTKYDDKDIINSENKN